MKILMRVMIEDLKPFDSQEISKAFNHWRRNNEKIPTPAGILKILHENRASKGKRLCDFNGDYLAYREYLKGRNDGGETQ